MPLHEGRGVDDMEAHSAGNAARMFGVKANATQIQCLRG